MIEEAELAVVNNLILELSKVGGIVVVPAPYWIEQSGASGLHMQAILSMCGKRKIHIVPDLWGLMDKEPGPEDGLRITLIPWKEASERPLCKTSSEWLQTIVSLLTRASNGQETPQGTEADLVKKGRELITTVANMKVGEDPLWERGDELREP